MINGGDLSGTRSTFRGWVPRSVQSGVAYPPRYGTVSIDTRLDVSSRCCLAFFLVVNGIIECLYCTGYYDDTIIQQIGQAPQNNDGARWVCGPWTEHLGCVCGGKDSCTLR